jgi:ASCH domain.
MKAITIWQPWAQAIATGLKSIETRSWYTDYRGPIAIHAAKKPINQIKGKTLMTRNAFDLLQQYFDFDDLPLGMVICTARLADCIKISANTVLGLGLNEFLLGDYTHGRYAWVLDNVKQIEPVPATGKQRLWDWKEGEKDD